MTIASRKNSTKRILFSFILPVGAALMISSCSGRMEPVYNVSLDTAPSAMHANLSSKQVGEVISRVATEKGWAVDHVKPGLLHCSTKWVDHSAVIDISYSKHDYSIELGSSVNLSDADGMIHRKYNQRIKELQAEIDRQLAQTSTK